MNMHVLKVFNKTFLYYIIYWLFYFILFVSYRLSIETSYFPENSFVVSLKISVLLNLVLLPFAILATHLVSEIILPIFFLKKRLLIFSLMVIAITLIGPMFLYFPIKYIVEPYIIDWKVSLPNYFAGSMKLVYCMVPLLWYKVSTLYKENELNYQKVINEKLESELKLRDTELKLLKSQIHPHFLFNTLNNLYSLSLEKSEKTPEIIIKLSDLLSYITYDCNSEKVSLEKEVDFIQSYIELEKLRYDKTLIINTSIVGDYKNKFIAPMILHTFIENSFKHGASKDTGNPRIDINLTLNDNWLNFNVFNSKVIEDDKSVTGIGIENAKRRLQLIYPNRHSLEIVSNRNTFNVFLEIQL